MSNTVIKVESLSKQYRLGKIGTGSFAHDMNRLWHRLRGKEDPYLKIGEVNDRSKAGNSEYVWSLRDINFEIKQGEAVGIIGRNGAGKSTLLKILSRTTSPTTGSVKIKGRVASLLEVGTGFHPELSGRENVFLNGAILGMTKAEIKSKFDEIVDFAGVERYIDTPVKRYSSGMYVRLAFGVAAHLEPEILIVDEVLAVGDAEFQKKAVGKMQDVSKGDGRTVLFVSHNMSTIQNLCNSAIYLRNGEIIEGGECLKVIETYLKSNRVSEFDIQNDTTTRLKIASIETRDSKFEIRKNFKVLESIVFDFLIVNASSTKQEFNIIFSVYNQKQELVTQFSTFFNGESISLGPSASQVKRIIIKEPNFLQGAYSINVALVGGTIHYQKALYKIENFQCFEIEGGDPYNNGLLPQYGSVFLESYWVK